MVSHNLVREASPTASLLGGERGSGEVVIEARGLTKRFGSTLAVDDLSFTVRPGLVTGLLGPNGAGKSTTMRLILGLNRPSRGRLWSTGCPTSDCTRRCGWWGRCWKSTASTADVRRGNHLLALAQSNGLPRVRVGQVLELTG